MHTLSVTALNEQIKTLLEGTFNRVLVEGELSRITFHNSGHIYFTLKDANSTLKAVIFRGNAAKLRFELKEGLKVILDGALSLYAARGEYQINCFSIEPAGHGALALAYEQLKTKLLQKGYFDAAHKKEIPKFVQKIALITSATGAALQDMLRVANARYRLLEIDVYDVLVQGQYASFEIANALKLADARAYDAIVLARGGGSVEDLWAFNEEHLADAIYFATTPIISAIGHEIDYLMSDFVADLRAPTPSAAMEMMLPDTYELYQTLDMLSAQMSQLLQQKIYSKTQELEHLKSSFSHNSVEKKLMQKLQEIRQMRENFSQHISFKIQSFTRDISQIKNNYPQAIEGVVNSAKSRAHNLQKMLESNHPKLKSKKGFAQISKDDKVIDISLLNEADIFEAQNDAFVISAKVLTKKEIAP